MLPAERLFQAQKILISKLSSYLHLVNMQGFSINDEDVEKLAGQAESGKIIIKEINSLNRVVSGLLGDIQKNSLFTESVKNTFEKNRSECSLLMSRIEEGISINSENLKEMKTFCKKRIDAIEKTVPAEMKMIHFSPFADRPELFDIEV